MKETWISERRVIQLPGCNHHLLCLLLSDHNQQKITHIGEQKSEKSQAKGDFWICPAKMSGVWAWESTYISYLSVQNTPNLGIIANR
ncbi:hypothetical protein [Nostoc sp.]|uniref:hypothetical protein n=1 Tax=Nostoc sp. TaxID=1180 RepID=UPI002FF903C5